SSEEGSLGLTRKGQISGLNADAEYTLLKMSVTYNSKAWPNCAPMSAASASVRFLPFKIVNNGPTAIFSKNKTGSMRIILPSDIRSMGFTRMIPSLNGGTSSQLAASVVLLQNAAFI